MTAEIRDFLLEPLTGMKHSTDEFGFGGHDVGLLLGHADA
jgi:hypothetical protein